MKVKELIKELKKFDENFEVKINVRTNGDYIDDLPIDSTYNRYDENITCIEC